MLYVAFADYIPSQQSRYLHICMVMYNLGDIKVKKSTQCLWLILSIVAIQHFYKFFTMKCHDCMQDDDNNEKNYSGIAKRVFANPAKMRSLAINNSTKFLEYLHHVSNSTLNKACETFGVSNLTLNSVSLQRQFLSCPGLQIYKYYSDSKGNVQLPTQFHKCKKMSFQTSNSGNKTALVSWSGSGGLWVRQLLEKTTGIYTGSSHDCNVNHIREGMLGEGITSEHVLVVTTHHTVWNFPQNSQIIYIIRDPFDAIMALGWNRIQSPLRPYAPKSNTSCNTKYFGKYTLTSYMS